MTAKLLATGILLLLTLVPSSVWSYCNYESKPLCGSSNQCGCVCDGGLVCEMGPPTTLLQDNEYEIILKGDQSDGDGLQYLASEWIQNFKVTLDNANEWTSSTLWSGKHNHSTGLTIYPEDLVIHLELNSLTNLVVVGKSAFDRIQRSLSSLTISSCPSLFTIDQRDDYPHYPLPKLAYIFISDTMIESLDFLNSQFSNKNSKDVDQLPAVNITLKNNVNLRSLGLTRPLSFRGKNNVDLVVYGSPLLAGNALNICFLKDKVRSIDLCMTDCTSCDRIWLMALKNNVGAQSTYNDFEKIGYPYYDSRHGERWSYEVGDSLSCKSCNQPHGETQNDFTDWPIEPDTGENETETDYKSLYSEAMKPKTHCTFDDHWDPFMVHHSCFKSHHGWTSCLDGCDCSKSSIRCYQGPRVVNGDTVDISEEDLPNLKTIDTQSFSSLTEAERRGILGFHIHDNQYLKRITADTSGLLMNNVNSVVITNNPRLHDLGEFISPTWTDLQYLELSHLSKAFSRHSKSILESIFAVPRMKLEVLDLSFSNLISLPRIDLVNRAPQLRYLLLEGNRFTSIDFDSFQPFYMLDRDVRKIPEMLEKRTPRYKGAYKAVKTLNLHQNTELVCDCHMALEHLSRVQSSLHWEADKLTHVMLDSPCLPGKSTQGCEIIREERDGCVYTNYLDQHTASDLQCIHEQSSTDELTEYFTERAVQLTGKSCDYNEFKVTFCKSNEIIAQDYSYFYCDKTHQCKPAAANDPILADLECESNSDCIDHQDSRSICPDVTTVGLGCDEEILECNKLVGRCQFKYPYKRSDFKIDLCKHRVRHYLDNPYLRNGNGPQNSKKTWVGDCGFRCSVRSHCRHLERHFPGKSFCCSNKGLCSTNCEGMCPAGWTGQLCETDLNTTILRCPQGWGGDQCSVKLCNKLFLCANGGTCEQNQCQCSKGFYGPECLTSQSCNNKDCGDPSTNFCTTDCQKISKIFKKYKFASGEKEDTCSEEKCNKKLKNSVCIDGMCGCKLGEVALKVNKRRAICLAGAAPCDLSNSGECSTLQPDMICSANRNLISKITLKPVAYHSYCICSDSSAVSLENGACNNKTGVKGASAALTDDSIELRLSGAMIGVICLAAVGIATVGASFMVVRKAAQRDAEKAMMQKKTSRTSQLASTLSLTRNETEEITPAASKTES